MKIQFVKLHPQALIPRRQTQGSAGYDLSACAEEPILIPPGEMVMVPLGFAIQIPEGYAGFVFSRSGLGRLGLVVAQGVGVIDSDYRGQWWVPLRNLSGQPITVEPGERIAQVVFMRVAAPELEEVEELEETDRGQAGFGSTGLRPRTEI
ncbi:dUTP diphosphatase [Acutalibacter intestini]|uniref:dUTP diphosphatase n=1 Tax=Acutalibacter intestini TaxID=3093659 RepID=UPI002AC8CE9D|nr:dUTP diphosphatase [Acutalibacter sp. M00204]